MSTRPSAALAHRLDVAKRRAAEERAARAGVASADVRTSMLVAYQAWTHRPFVRFLPESLRPRLFARFHAPRLATEDAHGE